ncbi:MAG TPA: nucleoside hydrolase [Armatimonadota bacterium]|jgi:inosine-uridine nucleoside N-ribohydrolase
MTELGRTSVILDTDIGDDIDDAYALGVCLRHPSIDLRGVATVWGDTTLRAAQARYLLALEGRPELPVAAGSRDPLDDQAPLGRNCQAAVVPAHEEERWRAGRKDGVQMLAELAAAHPGSTLLTIGALTNAARFYTEFPAEFATLERLVIMGGHLQSTLDYPEYNLACDPRATRTILACGKPMLMVGLDVTLQFQMTPEDLDQLAAAGTPLATALLAMTHMWQGDAAGPGGPLPTLHDPLAALAMVEPEVLRTVPRCLHGDRYGNLTPGPETPNVDFAVEVDVRRAMSRVLELVAG